jgi:hypothetical protein
MGVAAHLPCISWLLKNNMKTFGPIHHTLKTYLKYSGYVSNFRKSTSILINRQLLELKAEF